MRRTGNALVERVLRARPGESRRVAGMSLLIALIIATNYILKPVRSSLFLSDLGAQQLPYVYLLSALILGPAAAALSRLAGRYPVDRLLIGTAIFFAASLLAFWLAVETGIPRVSFLFYIWVGLVMVVTPTLFWLLANHLFYSNEARRLFAILTAGGLLGSIGGAGLTSVLVRFAGTHGLLLSAAAVFLLVAGVGAWLSRAERSRLAERDVHRERRGKRRVVGPDRRPTSVLFGSRYLGLLTALIVVTSLASTLVDYQFSVVAERAFERKDDLTRFFGTFFTAINGLALVLQLSLAGSIFSQLGVGAGLLLLPFMLFTGTLGFFLFPGLRAAGLVKFADDGLGNSVNKSSLETLYLPIPLEIKDRTKAFLDIFVERSGRALGGLLILTATSALALSLRHLGVMVLMLALPWMAIALALQREYVRAFRKSIARRDIDLAALTSDVRDPQGLAVLRQVLAGPDEKQILYALELSRGSSDPGLAEAITQLVMHPSAPVRAAALGWLNSLPAPPGLKWAEELCDDPSPAVSAEALTLLARTDPQRARERLAALVEAGAVERIEAVLGRLEGSRGLVEGIVDLDFVRRYHASERENDRALAARAIGFLPPRVIDAEVRGLLVDLLPDPSPVVARLAAASAAELGDPLFIPLLFTQLSRHSVRAGARRALARFGPPVAETAFALLEDPQESAGIRLALPRLLVEFESQKVVDFLLSRLPEADVRLHHQMLKALGKMRARYSRLHFDPIAVDRALDEEVRSLAELAAQRSSLSTAPATPQPSHGLLLRALDERIDLGQEHAFRLLGLVYPARDIYNAWHGMVNGRPAVRGAALEYLGNLLSLRHRSRILPLLEPQSAEEIHRRAVAAFGLVRPNLATALGSLSGGKDAWLAACAVTLIGQMGLPGFTEQLARLGSHTDPVLREAALAAGARAA